MMTGRALRVWHRRLGLTVAVFALVLSVTGLMLNHAGLLRLNDIKVQTAWVLNWYGLAGVNSDARTFDAGPGTVSWAGGWVFQNDKPLVGGVAPLRGVKRVDELLILAAPRELLLLTADGQLIERFLPSAFGADIEELGLADGYPVIRAGNRLFSAGPDGALWTVLKEADAPIDWSKSAPVAGELIPALNLHLRGEGLPLYRIILDLHSGHLFSQVGVWLMDGAAVLLIVLSLTGVWIWWPKS
jgi:PepSY-associated transmembrane protein